MIVFGGRELPRPDGDTCIENIFSPVPGAPCYCRSTSLGSLECKRRIESATVLAGVRRVVSRFGKPLAVDQPEVPAQATPFSLPWLTAATFP